MAAPEGSPTSLHALRPPHEPRTIVLIISDSISRGDLPGLSQRAGILLEGCDADLIVCDVATHVEPDAVAVDALARLQLVAIRSGRQVRLRHASGELLELLTLLGLSDVVPSYDGSGIEPEGQTEKREETRGVEEEADIGDLTG
nr:STAS domain-containing protein [Actinomycetota bacterium]